MAGLDANTLVQIGDEPNVLADRRAISEGLAVTGQNYVGSLLARPRLLDGPYRPLPAGRLLLQGVLQAEGRLETLGAATSAARPASAS